MKINNKKTKGFILLASIKSSKSILNKIKVLHISQKKGIYL